MFICLCIWMCVLMLICIYTFSIYVCLLYSFPQPLMASTIFRHLQWKKKCLMSTTFNRPYHTPAPENAKSHENGRSTSWSNTPTKTHIYITINNQCKSMQILVPQLYDQFHQNMHLTIQQKHDTQPLRLHINWGQILSSYQRLILCSHPRQNL